MANAKEIQSRMKSIRDTMKITNAMYMISSSKMKRAKKVLADTEPYFYSLQAAIGRILRHYDYMHLLPWFWAGCCCWSWGWIPLLITSGCLLWVW